MLRSWCFLLNNIIDETVLASGLPLAGACTTCYFESLLFAPQVISILSITEVSYIYRIEGRGQRHVRTQASAGARSARCIDCVMVLVCWCPYSLFFVQLFLFL